MTKYNVVTKKDVVQFKLITNRENAVLKDEPTGRQLLFCIVGGKNNRMGKNVTVTANHISTEVAVPILRLNPFLRNGISTIQINLSRAMMAVNNKESCMDISTSI